MKRIWLLPVAIAAAGVLTSASSGQAPNAHGLVRAGALHVTKECSQFDGTVGSFCTITSSNISVIRPGMRATRLQERRALPAETQTHCPTQSRSSPRRRLC